MRILRIRHLTLAVRDIDAARAVFERLFGAEAATAVDVAAFGARTQDLTLGESTVELASPAERDGALQRFIERRGEGVYTVALEVDDLDAAVAELSARGVRVSDPVEAAPGLRSAFVSMAATHGMSVQLVESMVSSAEDVAETADGKHQTADDGDAVEAEYPLAEDVGEPPAAPPMGSLDLTPDEWSDVD